jgi:iron complex outermembrane recepter protein
MTTAFAARATACTIVALVAAAAGIVRCPAYADPATELPALEIRDAPLQGSYVPAEPFSGSKTDTPPLELPMAVQVVPGEVMDDRRERTAMDAARNVSGVQAATVPFYDQLLIRGFDSDYGNV